MRILLVVLCFSFACANLFGQANQLVLPTGHTSEVLSVGFSADDKLFASASKDNTAKIWSTANGKLLRNLVGHTDEVFKIFFVTGQQKVITAGRDNLVKIWDLSTGQVTAELPKLEGGIYEILMTKNNRIVISTYGEILIYQAPSGKLLKSIKDGKLTNTGYASLSPDEKHLALVKQMHLNEPQINVVNISTGEKIPVELESCPWGASEAIFMNDSVLVSHCKGSEIFFTNIKTGTTVIKDSLAVKAINTLAIDRSRQQLFGKDEAGGFFSSSSTLQPNKVSIPFNKADQQKTFYSENKGAIVHLSGKEFEVYDTAVLISADGSKNNIPLVQPVSLVEFANAQPLMAIAYTSGEIEIRNSRSGASLFTLSNHLQPVVAMYNLADEYVFVGDDRGNVNKWKVATGSVVQSRRVSNKWIEVIDVSKKSNNVLAGTGEGDVQIIDINSFELKKTFSNQKHFVVAAAFSHDGTKAAAYYNKYEEEEHTVIVWDCLTGKKLLSTTGFFFKGANPFLPGDKKILISNYENNSAAVYNIDNGAVEKKFKAHAKSIVSVVPDAGYKMVASTGRDGFLHITNLATGGLLRQIKCSDEYFINAVFSPDANYIATNSLNNLAEVWEVSTGKKIGQQKLAGWFNKIKYHADGKLIIEADKKVYAFDALTNSLKVVAEGAWLQQWQNTLLQNEQSITVLQDGSSFAIYPLQGGKPKYFSGINDKDFLTRSSTGYYLSTAGASKLLHYVTPDLKVITFDQLDVKYNRPDLVLKAIGNSDTALISSYYKAYQKRIKKLGIDTTAFGENFGLPQAEFVNRNEIAYEQTAGQLKLQIKAGDTAYRLSRFNIWVNEVPLYGLRGLSLGSKSRHSFDTSVSINLSHGNNIIETSVTNVNGTESYRMPLTVTYTASTPVTEKLHFIGIGIDRFADAKQNLGYSVKDVRNLADSLKNKYGENISIDTLFNEQVTAANVKALKKKLLSTNINDKVLLTYSGHGLLSKEYDYFLSTYNVDFANPEKGGLPYDALENLLDSIPARKKLMLIDACHSGEVDKEEMKHYKAVMGEKKGLTFASKGGAVENTDTTVRVGMKNSFELMQELFVNVGRSTGATIISAAGGTQLAQESRNLQNGVFTFSILEYMKDHPTCTVSELKAYVNKRVPELTDGLQVPTTRTETKAVDWRVW